MKTMQQAYETMRAGMLAQGCKSMNNIGNCAYRGAHKESGAVIKCAVGHLISDKHYTDSIENSTVIDGSVLEVLRDCGYEVSTDEGDEGGELERFLVEAQGLHDEHPDEPEFGSVFAERLDALAIRYNLKVVAS